MPDMNYYTRMEYNRMDYIICDISIILCYVVSLIVLFVYSPL